MKKVVLALALNYILQFTRVEAELSNKIVQTVNGPVQGIVKNSRNSSVQIISFLGLRYAEPTSRFEPARHLTETWTIPKNASVPGSVCIQSGLNGSDDCLFLNVQVPDSALNDNGTPARHLAVMLWIHGGGFISGDGHSYGAEYLLEYENIILVTVNYRLGALGFITFETDSTFTSNNGLRDVVMALKWVQDNIAAFAGDPGRVTIFGESAGSAMVHYLLMSPKTAGLYHAAIMQSGSFAFWSHAENPENNAKTLAALLDCPNTEVASEIRKCLESISGEKILEAQSAVSQNFPPKLSAMAPFRPTANEPQNNAFFSGHPSSFFTPPNRKTNYPNKVPVMLGATRDEGSMAFTAYVLTERGQLNLLNTDWNQYAPKAFFYESFVPKDKLNEVSEKLRGYYIGNEPITEDNLDPLIILYTDALMILPAFHAAKDMAQNGMDVWPFIFSYYGQYGALERAGVKRIPDKVGHGDDILYLFSHPVFGTSLEKPSDEQFSKEMVQLWTSFATNGVPRKEWRNETMLEWSPINPKRTIFGVLELDQTPKVFSSYDIQKRLDFWTQTFQVALENDPKNIL